MSKNFMATMGIALTLVITPLVSAPAVAQNIAPASVSSTANSMMNLNTPLVPASKKASAKTVYKYTTSNLNMRSGIGTKHRVVKVLKKGTKVTIKSSSKGWNKVTVGGKTGWVSAKYLTSKSPKLVAKTKPKAKKINYKYTTAKLSMRTGSSTKYKVVKTLPRGTKVVVKSARPGWGKVSALGKTGWVSSKYLSNNKPKAIKAKPKTKATPKYSKNSLQGKAQSYLKSFGCANVPVTWVNSNRFNGQVDLSKQTMKLNKKMPAYRLKYVTAHECHHIKQARAYKGDWDRMFRDMKRAHPGVNKMTALERNADCATRRLGIKEWNYTKNCSAKQKAAAKRIWEGKRAY